MFTCTFGAVMDNIGRSHEELTGVLGPIVAAGRGPVKALNSNFGHFCQAGFEGLLKNPGPRPRTGRWGVVHLPYQRKPQGDATCFNSALELTIIPGADDDPPPASGGNATP